MQRGTLCRNYLESVHKLTISSKVVIPAKAGIQCFEDLLDAACLPVGRDQVRHDGLTDFINRLYIEIEN